MKPSLKIAQNYLDNLLTPEASFDDCWPPNKEPITASFDDCWPPLNNYKIAAPIQENSTIVTNPTLSDDVPEGALTKDVLNNPEEYIKQSIPLYVRDIKQVWLNNIKKKLQKKGIQDPDGSKAEALAKQEDPNGSKAEAAAKKSAEKAAHGHSSFLEEFKKHAKPNSHVLSPGSGIGHEQILAPEFNWTGLEFQPNSVSIANKQKKMLGLEKSQNYVWDFLKNTHPDETMMELGPGWEKKLTGLSTPNNKNLHPDAIYLKHACGGLTDSSMMHAVQQKIPLIFIASCCAHRYIGISHQIIAPHMKFEEYKKLTILSQDKSNPQTAKKAVDDINNLRKKYLENHGYIVQQGEKSYGPYLIAKLPKH